MSTYLLMALALAAPIEHVADEDSGYAPGVFAQAYAGFGVTHREAAPLAGVDSVHYPKAVPTVALGLAVSGVANGARAIEFGGDVRYRTAVGSRIEVRTPNATPRRPRARAMSTMLAVGLTWWPRAAGHHFGIGGEAGYAMNPFLIESKIGLPSYMVHGPIGLLRLEAQALESRLSIVLRPYAGAAVPRHLEQSKITRWGTQMGAVLQPSVRVYGLLHVYGDVEVRTARLPLGSGGLFDDFEVASTFGLMIRAPRTRAE